MKFLILIILTTIFYSLGAYFSKLYANSKIFNLELALCVILSYCLVSFTWLYIMRMKNQLAIMGVLFATICGLTELIIGIYIFGEPLTIYSKIGIFFGFISIIFLTI
jgi:hypothetical protein